MGDEDSEHITFMRMALREAHKCIPAPTAFCVGCVIVVRSPEPTVIAQGYSRELPGNTHAEANALSKARLLSSAEVAELFPSLTPIPSVEELLKKADIYTTLEPCSVRTSGLRPCAGALVEAKVRRCIIGAEEPPDFVRCEGTRKMTEAGIEVVWISELSEECLSAARRLH